VLSGRGLCDELITRPEESYRLCCVVVCDLETSRMGAPYTYDISSLKVNNLTLILLTWRKWWAPNNASKWQMGINSGFKGLMLEYTMIRGSVKSTGYPLLSPVSPSFPLPCVTEGHHVSTGLYTRSAKQNLKALGQGQIRMLEGGRGGGGSASSWCLKLAEPVLNLDCR